MFVYLRIDESCFLMFSEAALQLCSSPAPVQHIQKLSLKSNFFSNLVLRSRPFELSFAGVLISIYRASMNINSVRRAIGQNLLLLMWHCAYSSELFPFHSVSYVDTKAQYSCSVKSVTVYSLRNIFRFVTKDWNYLSNAV